MISIKSIPRSLIVVISFTFILLSNTAVWSQNLLPVRVSLVKFMGEAPALIALHNGYFKEEGLDVSVKYNSAGPPSIKDLFSGVVDIASVADTPLVYAGFDRNDFYIIAGVTHSDHLSGAVIRKEGRTAKSLDINGLKVGLLLGSGSEYLLDQYLLANGLSYDDIKIVDLKPKMLVKEIVKGKIDAIFSWHPHLLNAMDGLGDVGHKLPTNGMKVLDWLVVTKKEFSEKNPKILEKYLRSLKKANKFIHDNRDKAFEIYAKTTNTDKKLVRKMWSQFSYGLFLNESMLIHMEDQARWIIRKEGKPNKTIPNYLNIFNVKFLKKVKPEAVTLIK